MKKITSFLLVLLVSGTMLIQTGCFGSFSLTHKVYDFNADVGDKFVNTVVFWAFCIIPVYETTSFLDIVLFNLIEFWSGSNPIAMNEGDIEIQIVQSGDKVFEIAATKNKLHIVQIKGPQEGYTTDLIYNPDDNACYLSSNGETVKLSEIDPEDGSMLNLFLPDGKMLSIDPDSRDMNLLRDYMPSGSMLLADE